MCNYRQKIVTKQTYHTSPSLSIGHIYQFSFCSGQTGRPAAVAYHGGAENTAEKKIIQNKNCIQPVSCVIILLLQKKVIVQLKNEDLTEVYMDLIQLKIKKDNSLAKYIKIIRGFDSSLSVGAIKQKIEADDFVTGFDLEYYDVLEDINGTDRKRSFRDMTEELCKVGAQISIYQNGDLITLEALDNWLETINEVSEQTQYDIDREAGWNKE